MEAIWEGQIFYWEILSKLRIGINAVGVFYNQRSEINGERPKEEKFYNIQSSTL